MTDIVERLRQGAGHEPEDVVAAENLMDEAAAEVERLTAALWQVREDLAHLVQQIDAALEHKP